MTEFKKYQGLGNDFVVIDCDDVEAFDAERARTICDRHFGVGADGVLVVGKGGRAGDPTMRVVNADGSRPEMCGNGLRCVALHIARTRGDGSALYTVHTDAGPLACRVERSGDDAVVEIDMGVARDDGRHSTSFRGRSLELHRINTGNPHAILFDSQYDVSDIDVLGPKIGSEIASGANVEFVRSRPDGSLDVIVWERGVGRTLACGTGACATVVAAALGDRVGYDVDVPVHLPGGALTIAVSEKLAMRMRGPARFVFEGTLASVAS